MQFSRARLFYSACPITPVRFFGLLSPLPMKFLLALSLVIFSSSLLHAESFSERMSKVAVASDQGRVGVGILNLQTGESWFRDGKKAFPMQSVFKFPLAIAVLKQVDAGKLSLDQEITITPADFAPAWSPLRDEFKGDSARYTIRDLLERSMAVSDNTAADVLLNLIGGPSAIADLKLTGIRVDRAERELQPDSLGLSPFRPELADPKVWAAAIKALPEGVRLAALEKYLKDPRDTSTPEGMVDLLRRFYQGELLSKASTEMLLQIMRDTFTGKARLRAGLPTDWALAHKTGTGYEVLGVATAANDVGIAISPDQHAIIIVVFTSGATANEAKRDRLIADFAAAAIGN